MKFSFWNRKAHRWLALLIGLQALIWCLSGLYMTAIHIDYVHGDHLVKPIKNLQFDGVQLAPIDLDVNSEVFQFKTYQVNERLIYQVGSAGHHYLFDAKTGRVLSPPNEADVRQMALDIYDGTHNIAQIDLLPDHPQEIGGEEEPVWRVQFDDWLGSTLYFTSDSGGLRGKRSDLWRWFDFVWMLHIMDYEAREDSGNLLLRSASILGLLLTLSGICLFIYSFGHKAGQKNHKKPILKMLHRWLALLMGGQLVIWMLSGLMFNWLPRDKVSGDYLQNSPQKPEKAVLVGQLNQFIGSLKQFESLKLSSLLGRWVIEVKDAQQTKIFNLSDLSPVELNEEQVKAIAIAAYAGSGELGAVERQVSKTLENRKFSLPVWRVDFNDETRSSLYLSAETGKVYGVKTDSWRVFDFFWMLHIMDYGGRANFNNALVIFFVLINCFIGVTGLLLLSRSWANFNLWSKWFPHYIKIKLQSKSGDIAQIRVKKGSNLYGSLALAGYPLPSSCGGGGVCAQCMVKITPCVKVTEADQVCLSQLKLDKGFRLACQHRIVENISLALFSSQKTGKKQQDV